MTDQFHRSCMFIQERARGGLPQETYVPPTYADVPSLWRRWLEEDQLKVSEAESPVPSPSRHASWRETRVLQPAPKSSLKELLALQVVRSQEAEVYDEIQAHNQQQHVVLLGKTHDICNGRIDHLLTNVRNITAGRV
jgi:hypothetical protein